MSFLEELRRRKVFQVAAVYTVVAWVTAQIVDVVDEPLHLPEVFGTIVIVLLGIGFPIAVLLAWAYDMTPDGIQKTDDMDAAKRPPDTRDALVAVAVFPFKNLTESSPHGFLADAIPMELQSSLSRLSQLRVVSGLSSGAHSSAKKDLRSIARDLDVQYVISGSLAQVGDKIRIMAELNDAMHDSLLWSETYNAHVDDALDVQQNIAESIVNAFGGERLRAEITRAKSTSSSDQVAWQLVHKAKAYLLDYNAESVTAAIPLLKKSVADAPDYAEAHATLGLVTAEATLNGVSDDPAGDRALALESALKAERLAPTDSVVLRAAGPVHAYCGDNKNAVELLRRAVKLAPYDLGAWGYFGWPLTASGKADDLEELHQILDRLLRTAPNHPGSAYWSYHKSVALSCEDRCNEAIEHAELATARQPQFALGWMNYANILGRLTRLDEARAAADRCLQANPNMTAAHYLSLMSVLSDVKSVVDRRTQGLIDAHIIDAHVADADTG